MKRVLAHPEDLHLIIFHAIVLLAYFVSWQGWQHLQTTENGWPLKLLYVLGTALSLGLAVGIDVAVNFHNQIHKRVFLSRSFDDWFARLWTISSGWPAFAFSVAHHIHHEKLGTKDDWTITQTDSWGNRERIAQYAIRIWPWGAISGLIREWRVRDKAFKRTLVSEVLFFATIWFIPFTIDPVAAITVWLAPQIVGNLIVVGGGMHVQHASPFSEHSESSRDSITALNKWFNLLMFNIGFHHTHHTCPKVHWAALPALFKRSATQIIRSKARVLTSGNFKQASILATTGQSETQQWATIDQDRVSDPASVLEDFDNWYRNQSPLFRFLGRSGFAFAALLVVVIAMHSPILGAGVSLLEYHSAKKLI